MRNVILIGPMGSGKTTIGQRLAKRMGLEFCDSDHVIQQKTGVDINLIFEIEGEEGFRQRESRVIAELIEKENILLATGGGAILREDNRKLMRTNGTIVYLKTSIDQQMSRLRHDKTRPLIQDENRLKKLQELANVRDPLYAELADLTFPARNGSVDKTVELICQALQAHQSGKHSDNNEAQTQSNE